MALEKSTLDELRIDRGSGPQPRPRSLLLVVAVLFTLLVVAAAVWWAKRERAVEVRTITVRELGNGGGGPRTLLNASGYVVARRQATVSAKTTGKMAEVLVEEGMKVTAGQVLARLDAVNVEASLQLVEAQSAAAKVALAETRVRAEHAQREFRRVSELAKIKVASESDLDRAEAELKSLQARLEKQQADIIVDERQVAVLKQQLDDMVIRAPFSGVVTTKDAQPGEMVSPISAGGGFTRTGICTIVDMDSLEIEVDVNESFINRVQAGQAVEAVLDAYADWKIPSKVIAIIPTADRQKATVKVRVGFEKLDPRILPQMGVKVAFRGEEEAGAAKPVVSVPKAAVQKEGAREFVWVVQNGRAERRALTLGGTKADEVVVLAGLMAGERVIVESPRNISEGSRVKEAKP
ncbi:MAG: efflux RND transporter periplasmic adaptor subunit [Verrucomicrobia bacterium]|nr:efflux RND transporter periplasmic adaptor subunit [Verrucomicrobiota bacterium]